MSVRTWRSTRSLLAYALVAIGLVAAACGSDGAAEPPVASPTTTPDPVIASAEPVSTPSTPTPRPVPDLPSGPPPPVDTSIHSVPLEDVVFDTFNGGFARLSEASETQITSLQDRIRPVYQPNYEGPEGGVYLFPDELVIGIEGETADYAYPIKFLNFHELVNDIIDGRPVLISYCPLCGSGVVFDRRVDGETLLFGNTSALYQNDLVMFDHQTGSYWFQVGGEAIVGPLTDTRLDVLPSFMATWSDWLAQHPDTLVLSRDQGWPGFTNQRYESDPFRRYKPLVDDYRFPFPVDEDAIDTSIPASTVVVTVKIGNVEKAYPVELLGDRAVHDTVGGQAVVVFSRESGSGGAVYSPLVDGQSLTFVASDGVYTDQETGSTWDFFGHATDGPLEGQQLELLPSRRAFWFAISLSLPDAELYLP